MTFGIGMLAIFLAVIFFAAFADNMNPPSGMMQVDPTKVAQTPPFDKPGLRRTGPLAFDAYYVAEIFMFAPAISTCPSAAR